MSFTVTQNVLFISLGILITLHFILLNILIRGGSGRANFFLYYVIASIISVGAFYISIILLPQI